MPKFISKTKEFILDILFPKFCLNCQKEGEYLCEDCFSLIDIANRQYCPFCWPQKPVIDGKTCKFCRNRKKLTGLFCSSSYNNFIVKKMLNQFKYPPYVKELVKPLSLLIIAHLLNLDNFNNLDNSNFLTNEPVVKFQRSREFYDRLLFFKNKDFIIIPVPLYRKRLKERGFNQAEEIAKELSKTLKLPVINNVLLKIKKTPSQVELKKEQRKKNLKNAFFCQKPEMIKNKKILLIDDIFTTGSTMEECAETLKQAGAKEVWGVVIARG